MINGALSLRTKLFHKFVAPIDVQLTAESAGTEEQRIVVLNIRCLEQAACLMVVGAAGKVTFCSASLTALLGEWAVVWRP